MLRTIYRKPQVRARYGAKSSTFDDWLRQGRFPKPDGYLSDRYPFWYEETLAAYDATLEGAATRGAA